MLSAELLSRSRSCATPPRLLASVFLIKICCRGGSKSSRERAPGPLDHIFQRNTTFLHDSDDDDKKQNNEDWASADDIPKISLGGENRTDAGQFASVWVSPELKAYATQVGNARIDTIAVGGEQLDATLYDLMLCASRDSEGNSKDINGRLAQMLVKCVKDNIAGIPTMSEKRVFRYALTTLRTTSEAKAIFTSILRKAADELTNLPADDKQRPTREITAPQSPSGSPSQSADGLNRNQVKVFNLSPQSDEANRSAANASATGPARRRRGCVGREAAAVSSGKADAAGLSDLDTIGARLRRAVAKDDSAATERALRRLRRAATSAPEPPPADLLRVVKVRDRLHSILSSAATESLARRKRERGGGGGIRKESDRAETGACRAQFTSCRRGSVRTRTFSGRASAPSHTVGTRRARRACPTPSPHRLGDPQNTCTHACFLPSSPRFQPPLPPTTSPNLPFPLLPSRNCGNHPTAMWPPPPPPPPPLAGCAGRLTAGTRPWPAGFGENSPPPPPPPPPPPARRRVPECAIGRAPHLARIEQSAYFYHERPSGRWQRRAATAVWASDRRGQRNIRPGTAAVFNRLGCAAVGGGLASLTASLREQRAVSAPSGP